MQGKRRTPLTLFKTAKSFNDLKLNLKCYKTQQSLALQEETETQKDVLQVHFFSEEQFDCHASLTKPIISHQGYICVLAYTADNYKKFLLSSTSCRSSSSSSSLVLLFGTNPLSFCST